GAGAAARRVDHADRRAHLQSVHLSPILMNRALIILFVVIVTLPLAGLLAGVDGGDREAENRELAVFPHWNGTWTSARAYPGGIIRWFDDHFAFRDDLVRWYAESRLFTLRVS